MAGSLVVLARQSPLNGGTTVPGAQLFVYDAGTTTKRSIYTTSALSVQHSNPVVADANGRFAAVWINPDSGSYKTVLASASDTDPPASPFWTEDNIPSLGPITEGNFSATLTGMTAATTGTINYRITANAAGTGKICRLYATATITGVSNTTALTMTGLPAAVQPSVAVFVPSTIHNNTTSVIGAAQIAAAGSTITFYNTATNLSATGFTAANNKGVEGGWQIEYAL